MPKGVPEQNAEGQVVERKPEEAAVCEKAHQNKERV